MLFAVGVLLLAACASAQDTLCAKARAQHAQLDPNINYGTLSASAQRRLRILEATVKRCSTSDGRKPAYPTRFGRARSSRVSRSSSPSSRSSSRRSSSKTFDEAAFRAKREREMERINESLGGAMGRVAREDFEAATEAMVKNGGRPAVDRPRRSLRRFSRYSSMPLSELLKRTN